MPLQPESLEGGAEGLADLIELDLLLAPTAGVAADVARERASTLGPAATADLAMNVMQRRQRVLGDAYPFVVKQVGITRKVSDDTVAYEAMLAMSHRLAPLRSTVGSLHEAAELFEQLTVGAVRSLLGDGAQALRFAWPSELGRPSDFPGAIRWLADRMGVPVGSAYRPPRRQDGGVDVVGWRPFPDAQPGFPICLAQCTLERDFVHKSTDIDLRVWSGWLGFDIDPTCALAIPYTVEKAEDWREMASRVIVLDRLRLAGLLVGQGPPPGLRDWITGQLEGMREET
jgi:hypothetical protein